MAASPPLPPNPTGVQSVKAVTLRNTVNIPGCPPHPDWMIWTIANLLGGTLGALDSYGRPVGLFSRKVHDICPRREHEEAHALWVRQSMSEGDRLPGAGHRGALSDFAMEQPDELVRRRKLALHRMHESHVPQKSTEETRRWQPRLRLIPSPGLKAT